MDIIKVDSYCWNCGELDHSMFTACDGIRLNIKQSTCPACGAITYVFLQDLLELHDRQTNRGIPRL